MDNRIFNVNGRLEDDEVLLMTLKLAMRHEWGEDSTIEGWSFDTDKGMILHKYMILDEKHSHVIPFPSPLTAEELLPVVLSFLKSEKAKTVTCEDWDEDADHDGHNGNGWRVYTETWGRIGRDWTAFIAVKPAYMWYGK